MNLDDFLGTTRPEASSADPELVCSRRGCRQAAVVRLLWNNPRIHTPERRKVWLACGEHEAWLTSYLRDRGLYQSTEDITA